MELIRSLSGKAEFLLVIAVAFGYFILVSTLSVFGPPGEAAISDAGLQFLCLFELTILGILGGFLAARGWDGKQLGLAASKTDLPIALALGVVAYLAYVAIYVTLGRALSGGVQVPEGMIERNLHLSTVLVASVVNGAFEELFLCGYVITALKKTQSTALAINVSIAIRLSYHLYQGTGGVISIIPVGVVFAHWFARTGRLWPIAIAHCLFDILGLWPYLAK